MDKRLDLHTRNQTVLLRLVHWVLIKLSLDATAVSCKNLRVSETVAFQRCLTTTQHAVCLPLTAKKGTLSAS